MTMKIFTLQVPDDKVKFVKELMNNLNIKWNIAKGGVDKSLLDPVEDKPSPKTYLIDEEARKNAAKLREESLKDVITRIETMRKDK
jgi:hypothetical protein